MKIQELQQNSTINARGHSPSEQTLQSTVYTWPCTSKAVFEDHAISFGIIRTLTSRRGIFCYPCRVGKVGTPPPSLQKPLAILGDQEVLVVVLHDHNFHCLYNAWLQWQLPQASPLISRLPLSVPLRAFHQVHTFAAEGIQCRTSKHDLF